MKKSEESMANYLDVLNEEQRAAVVHEGSPLLILAGAGSGKTRVITTKIAYLIKEQNVEPWSILAVTFTKKAANEMKERAVALEEKAADAQIRTFHSFGSWFLRRYAEAAGLSPSFTVYDDDDMATLLKKAVPSLSQKEVRAASRQIALAKDYCLGPEDDLSFMGSEFDINSIYSEYQKRLLATGNADFGDLIMLPVLVMQKNPEIADYIHNRFKVIMVDEYQDSNIAQYKLLQMLSGIDSGKDCYVCVVGDDDQSIYHFRGAEVENILTFPEKFPGTQIIRLERNYRSTAKILEAAELVVNKNEKRLGKHLVADKGNGAKPVLTFLPDASSEAVFCADLIQKSLSSGQGSYSDWALLYRTNAQSLAFEKEFIHRKIPYVIVGSLKFYEREEIKDALSYLALFANPKDEISFRRIINKPARGLGEKTQDKILEQAALLSDDGSLSYRNLIETAKEASSSLSKKAKEGAENFVKLYETLAAYLDKSAPLSKFIERMIQDSGLDEYHRAGDEIEGTGRVQNLQELVNSAVVYEGSMEGLLSFLDAINLDRTLDLQNESSAEDSVTLITLHNTKGLEYNKVIITGLEEGVFPRQDKVGAELEEERRLFYVGITRARNELYVTSTGKRLMYGSWQFMRPSPFLKESSSAFTILGNKPFGFEQKKNTAPLNFGRSADAEFWHKSGKGNPVPQSNAQAGYGASVYELAEKWKKGMKIYHDDYGYGIITSASANGAEYVIEVTFEGGGKKKFLPAYQAKSLEIIKD
ncbi:MAG: UvrD-helicase domain-containing protein [Treponema sp.]|nr:UvrD-helicase domain-containing protein [Treponema sp.]